MTVVSTRNVCRRKWKEETSNECGLTCHKNPARTRRVPGTDRAHRHPVSRNPRPVVAQPDGLRSVAHRPPRAPGGSASTADRGCPHTTLGSALFQARRERMGAWRPAATPRATRVAPKVDKYRRSSRVRSAEEHPWWPCGVAKSPGTRHGPGHGDPRGPVSVLRSTQIRTCSFQIRLTRHLCRPPTCNDFSDDFSDDSRCASLARRPSERTLPLVGRRWSSAARRHWPLGSFRAELPVTAAGGGVHGVSDDAARSSRQCNTRVKRWADVAACYIGRNTARHEEVAAPASGVGRGLSPVTRARGPRARRTSKALWSRDVWS